MARQNAFSCFFLLLLCVSACKGDWCVTNFDASPGMMQYYIDSFCDSVVECRPIKPGGACYYPNTLRNHSSWVANEYYRKFGFCPREIGQLYVTSPSYGNCHYN